jgi:hypothetical protein
MLFFVAVATAHFAGSVRLWMWWDHHWADDAIPHPYAGLLTMFYEFPGVWIPFVRQVEANGVCLHGYLAPDRAFDDIPWKGALPVFWAANSLFWGLAPLMALRWIAARRGPRYMQRGFEIVSKENKEDADRL